MIFLDVILPLPLAGLFTYSASQKVDVGCRVIVQFGKKKFYSAIVAECYESDEEKTGIKEITSVLDNTPIVLPSQLALWKWISEYYMCHLGEVYKAALPSVLKLESETQVSIIADVFPENGLSPVEEKIYDLLLQGKSYTIAEVGRKAGVANPIPAIRALIEKELISTSEQIERYFTPKTQDFVKLKLLTNEAIHEALNSLSRAQLKLFTAFLELSNNDFFTFSILKKDLLATTGFSLAVLNSLVAKNILLVEKREVIKKSTVQDNSSAVILSDSQQKALNEIQGSFLSKNITLLHGVTSSGKTEIYIKLIAEQLSQGKQVLYLLPEIALTTQITERLQAVFCDALGVYHSKFTDNERAEVWNNLVKDKGCKVILGVRSSIFLPFKNLGLVIVDEEHESSYKQQDPAPRYHGRNAAMVLASIHQAKTLLGTATPAVETYYNAISGKYGLVELTRRHEGLKMPLIHPVNTKELRRKKIMKSALFSPELLEKMAEAFDRNEQVILFRNRRGFAPYTECKICGYTQKCLNCDVNLTFHKHFNVMSCHYCGAHYPVLRDCPSCNGENSMAVVGFGTERIEEEIGEYFPDKRISRMDTDTTRSKNAYERIIDSFSQGKTDILIGTQMVSKGLDFDNVSLVGILQADSLLNQPDFRANERAFQMLEQVSGRAGRKNKQGLVILQTTNPDSLVIQSVCKHDYNGFYDEEIKERELFKYPPFYRIFHLVLRSKDSAKVNQSSVFLAQLLQKSFGSRVLGPIEPVVGRVQTLFIRRIVIKIENNASAVIVREQLNSCINYFFSQDISKSILLHVDVDPM